MAIVMNNVKDEIYFSNLSFMKNNLRNILTTHLDLVIMMSTQKNPKYISLCYNNEEFKCYKVSTWSKGVVVQKRKTPLNPNECFILCNLYYLCFFTWNVVLFNSFQIKFVVLIVMRFRLTYSILFFV
jgi:hypothetical protein